MREPRVRVHLYRDGAVAGVQLYVDGGWKWENYIPVPRPDLSIPKEEREQG